MFICHSPRDYDNNIDRPAINPLPAARPTGKQRKITLTMLIGPNKTTATSRNPHRLMFAHFCLRSKKSQIDEWDLIY